MPPPLLPPMQRYKICGPHMMADALEVDGIMQRFCQQVKGSNVAVMRASSPAVYLGSIKSQSGLPWPSALDVPVRCTRAPLTCTSLPPARCAVRALPCAGGV